jgi:hypothetical protein
VCGETFSGLEVEEIEGRDYCNGCRAVTFPSREEFEDIPF